MQQAVRRLAQFQRVTLAPGRSADVTLHVTAQALSSWSTDEQQWVLGKVYVGSSSADLPLHTTTTVTGWTRTSPGWLVNTHRGDPVHW